VRRAAKVERPLTRRGLPTSGIARRREPPVRRAARPLTRKGLLTSLAAPKLARRAVKAGKLLTSVAPIVAKAMKPPATLQWHFFARMES
jgi:hypothetical protein